MIKIVATMMITFAPMGASKGEMIIPEEIVIPKPSSKVERELW